MDLSQTYLVTHKDCMDGAGCAAMFLKAGGDEKKIRYVPAGRLESFIKKNDVPDVAPLLIADLGFNDLSYFETLEKRGNFFLIDHHATSLTLEGRANTLVTKEACGTELMRRHLLEGSGPCAYELGKVIDDHDRWILKDPRSERLATWFSFVGQRRFVSYLNTILKEPFLQLFAPQTDELVDLLLEKRQEDIDQDLKRVKLADLDEYKAAYCVCSNKAVSEMLQQVLDLYPDVQVAVQVNVERGVVSMRSRFGEPDVAAVCARFGGGGHKAAAGHRTPDGLLEIIIEETHGA